MNFATGRHMARVAGHTLGKASTGTGQVVVDFEFMSEGHEGQHLTWYGFLTDGALPVTLKALATLGWEGDDLTELNGTGILQGNEAEVVVEYEEYNGETRPKIRWVNTPGGGAGVPMVDADAAVLAQQLRGKILAARGGPKPSARPGPSRASRPSLSEPDDDLPFAPLRLTRPWL